MNKSLKRFLSFVFVITLGLVLVACNNDNTNDGSTEDTAAVVAAMADVTIESIINDNDSKDEITLDLTLPLKSNDVIISWSSNVKDVVTDTGKVNRPDDLDKEVTLTATFKLNEALDTKTFELIVLKVEEEEVPVEPVLDKVVEFNFTTTGLGFSYSSNNNTASTVQNIVDGSSINVVSTRAAANSNHGTYKDPFLVISASTKEGQSNGSLEIDLGVNVSSMKLDAAFWSDFDAEQVTKLEVQAFVNGAWVTVLDLRTALNNTIAYQTVEVLDLNTNKIRLYAEGVAPTGTGNNGARILFDNMIFYGESSDTTPVEPDTTFNVTFNTDGGSNVATQSVKEGSKANMPVNPTKSGFDFLGWFLNDVEFDFNNVINANTTLIAKWEVITVTPGDGNIGVATSPATSENVVDGTTNIADILGLDASIFTVYAFNNSTASDNGGLGLYSELRIYGHRDTGDGALIEFVINENYTITNVEFKFVVSTNDATGLLVLGNEEVNLTFEELTNTTQNYQDLNIARFTLKNTDSITTNKNGQIRIESITITFKPKN